MNNEIRSNAGIECIKFIARYYIDDLVVLRNHLEIFDGSYRDIDLLLHVKKSKLNDILDNKNISDTNHKLISFLERKNFLQLKIFSNISMEVFIIDIWDDLSWKGIPYFIQVKNESSFKINHANGINFFPEKEQLLLATCKCLTQTGKVKEKYKIQFSNIDISKELKNYFGFDYFLLLNKNKFKRFLILSTYTKFKYTKEFFIWAFAFIRYFLKKKGKLIELVGPDGSGKTSLSEQLVDKRLYFADSKYFHGRIPILPRISNLIYFKRSSPERLQPNSDAHLKLHQTTSIKKFTILHIFYYSLDALLSRIILFFWLKKDQIIVVDRSPYDIYARSDYSNINSILKKFYVFCHPKPCVRLLLKADPIIINDRKNELSVDEIIKQYHAYELNLKGTIFKEINTSSGIDKAFKMTVESSI